MIKVFYWAPFISKIATPIAVINSAISLKNIPMKLLNRLSLVYLMNGLIIQKIIKIIN